MSAGFDEKDGPLTYPDPDDDRGLGGEFANTALELVSLGVPLFGAIKFVYSHLSIAQQNARLRTLFKDLTASLKKVEVKQRGDARGIQDLREKLESTSFKEALIVAAEQTVRASNQEQVGRFVAVLAGSLTPSQWHPPNDNVSDLIRDLSRLTEYDIKCLQVLSLAFKGLLLQHLGSPNPFLFTTNNETLDREVSKHALDREDFDAACGRLVGFGLAIEEPWPTTRTQPHSRCFRPTRRGIFLLDCLSDSA